MRVRVGDGGAERILQTVMNKQKSVNTFKVFFFYISICANIIPQTPGSPSVPLAITVYQLSGMNTPVYFWVTFITAMPRNPKNAFASIDLINL